MADIVANNAPIHSVLNSSFPVLLPEDAALFLPEPEFQALVKREIGSSCLCKPEVDVSTSSDSIETPSLSKPSAEFPANPDSIQKAPFIHGLENDACLHRTRQDLAANNQTLTTNADVTNISSRNPFIDLFYDLNEYTVGEKLGPLVENASREDPLLKLTLIFNARSIHIGKSNKIASYKAFGWLAETHPLTLLGNLKWLVRPLIVKKAPNPDDKQCEKAKDATMNPNPSM